MKKVSLAKSNAVIVIHEETTGLAYDLRDYLLKQGIRELLFIAHPLLYLKKNFKIPHGTNFIEIVASQKSYCVSLDFAGTSFIY